MEFGVITFFEQAGVDKENEKAADRRSGQCPRNSEQLHPGVGRFCGGPRQPCKREREIDAHSTSAHRHALTHILLAMECSFRANKKNKKNKQ